MLKIVGRPAWWFLGFFVPCLNWAVMIVVMNDLSRSFGQGVGFTVGFVLLSPIFLLILSYGGAQYRGPAALAGGIEPGSYGANAAARATGLSGSFVVAFDGRNEFRPSKRAPRTELHRFFTPFA